MLGTLGGALEARQIDASDGKLAAEVEEEEGVLVIRRIHVSMRLTHLEENVVAAELKIDADRMRELDGMARVS